MICYVCDAEGGDDVCENIGGEGIGKVKSSYATVGGPTECVMPDVDPFTHSIN